MDANYARERYANYAEEVLPNDQDPSLAPDNTYIDEYEEEGFWDEPGGAAQGAAQGAPQYADAVKAQYADAVKAQYADAVHHPLNVYGEFPPFNPLQMPDLEDDADDADWADDRRLENMGYVTASLLSTQFPENPRSTMLPPEINQLEEDYKNYSKASPSHGAWRERSAAKRAPPRRHPHSFADDAAPPDYEDAAAEVASTLPSFASLSGASPAASAASASAPAPAPVPEQYRFIPSFVIEARDLDRPFFNSMVDYFFQHKQWPTFENLTPKFKEYLAEKGIEQDSYDEIPGFAPRWMFLLRGLAPDICLWAVDKFFEEKRVPSWKELPSRVVRMFKSKKVREFDYV